MWHRGRSDRPPGVRRAGYAASAEPLPTKPCARPRQTSEGNSRTIPPCCGHAREGLRGGPPSPAPAALVAPHAKGSFRSSAASMSKRERSDAVDVGGRPRKTLRHGADGGGIPRGSHGVELDGERERERPSGGRWALPEGWLHCPPFGNAIGCIIPSKVPLGPGFKEAVPPGLRYSPESALRQLHHMGMDVGLVIDLTKTSRYYRPTEWTNRDVKYIKMPCSGHEEVPDEETVNNFVFEVSRFFVEEQKRQRLEMQRLQQEKQQHGGVVASGPAMRPPRHVFVHCTHGHNRTGFCIIHFLLRWHGGTVAQRLAEFAEARPPGIYKEEYVQALFDFYHEPRPSRVVCPATPEWKHEGTWYEVDSEEEDRVGAGEKGVSKEARNGLRGAGSLVELDLNDLAAGEDEDDEAELQGKVVAPDLNGHGNSVSLSNAYAQHRDGEADKTGGVPPRMTNDDILGSGISDEHQLELQRLVARAVLSEKERDEFDRRSLNKRSYMFPGSQPVSLSIKNMKLLRARVYHVTWKADGMRYMMLLCQDGCYLIDRNFCFRRVQLRFPSRASVLGVHHGTLLDGEMVIDTVKDPVTGVASQLRRYLIYDAVMINMKSIAQMPFGVRWHMIEDEILEPRKWDRLHMAHQGLYDYDKEPFKVRRKDFWALGRTEKILQKFIPTLCHESDGLIFQSWLDHYIPRTHEGLLKWKYAHMNSVDFLLKRSADGHWALLLIDRNMLKKLDGAKVMFPNKSEEEVAQLEGQVVECSWRPEDQTWEFMRTRPDKEHPNAWHTYTKVMASIEDNITEEKLLEEIKAVRKLPMYQEHETAYEKESIERHKQQHKLHLQQEQLLQQQSQASAVH